MAKGQKSSASAATRKKHAKKAAGDVKQELPLPKEKKKEKGKGKKKEPRVKVFTPPTKPAPVRPDPLDSLGIAKRLDPDLLIVLRRLGKKDSVTKRKALEELQSGWIDNVLKDASEDENGVVESMLQTSLPVWLHHLPSLFLSASRRIRLLAASIHTALLRIQSIHEQVIYSLQETGDAAQIEAILGSWCMASEDVERAIANQARQAWDLVFRSPSTSSSGIDLDKSFLGYLLAFTRRALFDPLSLYADLNPVQPTIPTPQLPAHASQRNKAMAKRPPLLQPDVDEKALARKPEEEEESEGDRKGRFRVGALGVLRWVLEKESTSIQGQLSELLASPLLWTALYHGPSPPFCDIQSSSSFLGDEQPLVRKTAWNVLRSLLDHHNEYVQATLLPILSPAVLRSCWVEHDSTVRGSMWEVLLKFLTRHPNAWGIDLVAKTTVDDDDDDDDESDREATDDSDGEKDEKDNVKESLPPSKQSDAFREFLTFLSLGCYGSPVQGYPTVVIILSTIPPSIIGRDPESWTDFFTSLWAALDGRAFTSLASERTRASTAFLNALLECIILLIKRSRVFSEAALEEDRNNRRQAVGACIEQQFKGMWEELAKDRLRVPYREAGKLLARTLTKLGSMDGLFFTMAWEPITLRVMSSCSPQQTEPLSVSSKRFSLQLQLLRGLWEEVRGGSETTWNNAPTALVCSIASVLVEQTNEQFDGIRRCRLRPTDVTSPQRLSETLTHFGSLIFSNSDLTSRIDTSMNRSVMPVLRSEPAMQLFLAFLLHRGDDAACLTLWRDALKVIASDPNLQGEVLPVLLGAAEKGDLPSRLRPEDGEMDAVANVLVDDVLDVEGGQDNELRRTLLIRLLRNPYFFLTPRTTSSVIHRIAQTFSEKSRALIHDSNSPGSLKLLRSPLMLLSSVIETRPDVALSRDIRESLPDLFVFGHALPCSELLSSEAKALCLQARQIWSVALTAEGLDLEQKNSLLASVRILLRDLIADVDSRVSPEAILQIVAEGHAGTSVNILRELFPSQEAFEDMLRDLSGNPLDPSLAIVDSLVPPPSMWADESRNHFGQAYDRTGLCEYSRIGNALLGVATNDRDLVRQNMWLLRHFLILSISATDRYLIPAAVSPYFSQDVGADIPQEISTRVKTLTAFLLSDNNDEGWHSRIVQLYLDGKDDLAGSVNPSLVSFILDFLKTAAENNNSRESRVLYSILQHMLNGAGTGDAEHWMILARRMERQSSRAALAIIRAVNESGLEPPSLDRYRNTAAADILGIPAARAGTDGLATLHRLALAAPDAESDIIFLPQNRAVRLMKTCQEWVESDEDIDEDVESEMTLVFHYLAPILQNIPGAHWGLVFDIIENNLENSTFSDSSSLIILARTLKLILIIQDLCRTNKSLRADWVGRELNILALVRDLVQNAPSSPPSEPRAICWNLALSIVQNLPPSLIDEETLSKMARLILDRSHEVVKMSYSLLYRAAQKRTEHLVVEAGVDTSFETARYDIPAELLQVLEAALQPDDSTDPNVFAYLLGWAVIFDLFDDASLRVKMSYATQLRDLDLIGSSFLPFIFDLLELNGGRTRPLSLDPWSVEDYYVQFYDPETRLSPRLFAAHLYYRALLNVPSLVANWWAGCKDRQLLTAVANFTTKYYSPVLIAAELRHIRDPAAVSELSGENWAIKIASNIGEVTAAYTVDEQVMEIAIRLPPDYPLHGIEVRDVQKLGVDENRWRGWLLAVQQIVSSQNGRIVDGLSMFKKNVTHHFENQTECAICYSIISVTELSLPKKRCKTCKNKFHAGCLFKWFNTSHTSSCPLCRSDFI